MNRNEERSAAEKAREVLRTITPSTPRTDEIVHRLRLAAGLANAASKAFRVRRRLTIFAPKPALRSRASSVHWTRSSIL